MPTWQRKQLAFLLLIAAVIELSDAVAVVDVYRLVQYDLAGLPFGSRVAALNHHAASAFFSPADLSRTVILLPLKELELAFIREYIGQKKPLGGLLLLLPPIFNPENSESGDQRANDGVGDNLRNTLVEVERLLIHANIPVILADIKKNDVSGQPATATTGGYKLVVSAREPKKVASPTIANIQYVKALSLMHMLVYQSDWRPSPIGSFHLYRSKPTVLTLLKGWLPGLKTEGDSTQLPTIAIVASYDTFGAAPGFSNVAGGLGLNVGLKHKKINISNPRVAWEHEQFSRMRVTAATISEFPVAPDMLENAGGLSDNRQFTSEASIVRSVKLVAESLARHIYSQEGKNINIFADDSSLAINPSYISSWLNLLSTTPRVAPFLSKNDPLVVALKKELEDHTADVKVQHEAVDGMFTFYDSTSGKLHIYQVASVTFDLLLLLVVGSYLITLFSFLVITTRGLDDLISIFRRPPSRKVKSV
ncbi:hypothetical protein Leryth_014743 [Lithospermum erythrorhizon]|nr:hypothetical protein Leryth_014743 [Lithospermum erythrorhizon]